MPRRRQRSPSRRARMRPRHCGSDTALAAVRSQARHGARLSRAGAVTSCPAAPAGPESRRPAQNARRPVGGPAHGRPCWRKARRSRGRRSARARLGPGRRRFHAGPQVLPLPDDLARQASAAPSMGPRFQKFRARQRSSANEEQRERETACQRDRAPEKQRARETARHKNSSPEKQSKEKQHARVAAQAARQTSSAQDKQHAREIAQREARQRNSAKDKLRVREAARQRSSAPEQQRAREGVRQRNRAPDKQRARAQTTNGDTVA